jgi:DNA-binding FadR family transcriptional regulator
MKKLNKIEKQSTLKSVINALRDYIIENKLTPGDGLPSEHALSESFGISRNIIREGISYYRTFGIIESKPKIGAVIVSLCPKDPFDGYMPFLEIDSDGEREAAEMRMALECGAVPLMIAGCTDDDIQQLTLQLKEFEKETCIEAEIKFHSIMLKMTANRLIESMIPLTIEFFAYKHGSATKRNRKNIIKDHQVIIDAFRERNVQKLSKALQLHYKYYFKNLKKERKNVKKK